MDVIAAKLCITKNAARRRIYRSENCAESIVGATYSAREVAEGFCIGRDRLKKLIESGALRATRLQRSGKLHISSEAVVDFVREHPREIPWSRCLNKSLWLRDILESTRYQEVSAILCVSPRSLRSWVERGILRLRFDCNNVPDFFPMNRCIGCWTSTLTCSIFGNAWQRIRSGSSVTRRFGAGMPNGSH